MILKKLKGMMQYGCEITDYLDSFLVEGIDKSIYHTYIHLMDRREFEKESYLAIRVPGCTIGHVKLDYNKDIVEVKIERKFGIFTCGEQINNMSQFVMEHIDLDKEVA